MFRNSISRLWHLGASLFLIVAAVDVARAAARPPNIVFILADDLGWADVAFHDGSAPTPHLDRLAREGVELTQHYVAPVCTPTRAGFMTGRLWSRFGVFAVEQKRCLPWDTVTLPRALKQAGYDTALIGKWHLGSKREWGPRHYGFDHTYGSFAGGVGPYEHLYKRGPYSKTWHRNGEYLTDEGHVTDVITAEAVSWIQARREAPYFLYLPFTAPHLPVMEPAEWLAKVPAGTKGEVRRHYVAAIMHFDDAVGRVLAAIERTGRRENTLVVFSSDNGGSQRENNNDLKYPGGPYPEGPMPGQNHPLRAGKGSVYEGGIRTPTIAWWPGRLAPGKIRDPAQITDWMPTFCALAGYRPERDLKWDGVNLWPRLTGQVSRLEPRVIYTPFSRSTGLRDGDWKLVVTRKGDQAELFNLERDPQEANDLARDMPDRVARMRERLAEAARADRDAVVKEP
jgi:arylsulfatase A-like enzyme